MVIYLDTETTGLRPGKICQLSYVLEDAFGIKAKNFYFKVDYIEPSASAVHGLTKEKLLILSNGRTFKDNAFEIYSDFSNAGLIISHNTSFDFSFLREEFDCVGVLFNPVNSFCSMKSAVSVCRLKRTNSNGYKYPKLSELTAFLGITDKEILLTTQTIFGSKCGYHDARFDTTAVYLACLKARQLFTEFKNINDYI